MSSKVKESQRQCWGMIGLGISDLIASFINEVLSETDDGSVELQRVDLANRFNCVPSQINYVISTRFSPERGYVVQSRRGGNGYIRIQRVREDPKRLIMHTINVVGDEIDGRSGAALLTNAAAAGALEEKTARLILSATGDAALKSVPPQLRNTVRAEILKQMLIHVL